MVEFSMLYFDWKDDKYDRGYDYEFMRTKAERLRKKLAKDYNITDCNITKEKSDKGYYVSMEFECGDDLIKKIFKECKKTKPYVIRTKWKDCH